MDNKNELGVMFMRNNKKISISRVNILKTIRNVHSNHKYLCKHTFPELTALCPTSNQPDFYTMKLCYEPEDKIIELKSFKSYLNSFRDRKIYHEELANEILNDFIAILSPRWVFIEMNVNTRGGFSTIIRRYWSDEKGDDIIKAITSV